MRSCAVIIVLKSKIEDVRKQQIKKSKGKWWISISKKLIHDQEYVYTFPMELNVLKLTDSWRQELYLLLRKYGAQ